MGLDMSGGAAGSGGGLVMAPTTLPGQYYTTAAAPAAAHMLHQQLPQHQLHHLHHHQHQELLQHQDQQQLQQEQIYTSEPDQKWNMGQSDNPALQVRSLCEYVRYRYLSQICHFLKFESPIRLEENNPVYCINLEPKIQVLLHFSVTSC